MSPVVQIDVEGKSQIDVEGESTQTTKKRVALVTGANRGIGLAVATALARKGLTVIMGSREEANGVEAQKRLTDHGLDAHFTLLDVGNPTSIMAALGRIDGHFGRLDILVNNAGIMIDKETGILELSLGLLHKTLEINTFGPLLLCQGCVPLMQKHNYGRIVNISSTMGALAEITNPESNYKDLMSPAYRLSKLMLNGITALLAQELNGHNILVNSVCPGWVRTDLGGPLAPILPEEAAGTAVWLATLPDNGPTGGFYRDQEPIPW